MEKVFVGFLLEQGASEKTRRNYRADVRHFATWLARSHLSLIAVTHETIEAYKRACKDARVPLSTINRRLSALRMFFKCAVSEQWINDNPMDAIANLSHKPHHIYEPTPAHDVQPAIRLPMNLQEDIVQAVESKPPEPKPASFHPVLLALLWVGALASIIYITARITMYVLAQNEPITAPVSTLPADTFGTLSPVSATVFNAPALVPEEPEVEIVAAKEVSEYPSIQASEKNTDPRTYGPTDTLAGSNMALHVLGATTTGDRYQFIQFEKDFTLAKSLAVFGDTLLSKTTIAGSLLVDGLVHISPDGIETITDTLHIQKRRFAPLSLMGDALVFDTQGNAHFANNVTVAGNLQLDGELYASTISGTFRKILIANPPISSESGQYVSRATTGTTAIVSDLTQAFVATAEVTEQSLIYITPLSSTQNQVLYVQSVYPGQGFIVTIDQAIDEDIRFNWWLIN